MSNEAPNHPTARAARVTALVGKPSGRPRREPEAEALVIAFEVPQDQMPQVLDDDTMGWGVHHGHTYHGVVTVPAARRLAMAILAACDDAEKL